MKLDRLVVRCNYDVTLIDLLALRAHVNIGPWKRIGTETRAYVRYSKNNGIFLVAQIVKKLHISRTSIFRIKSGSKGGDKRQKQRQVRQTRV